MIQVKEYKPRLKYNIRKKLESKRYSVQFLPESLVQESLHKNFTFKEKKLKTAYLVDIAHNLLLKYYFKKENLFNLSSVVLKEKYGYLYNFYMDYLIEKKILNLVKKHQKGKNARVYKLNEKIIGGRITRYKNEDAVLLRKYKNAISSIETGDLKNNGILPDVKIKLVQDLFSVQIQFDKAIFFLDSTLQDPDIYNRNKYSVECINDKHIFYHFDSYGRIHTNFTILKSFIRKNCLLINGEETFEIDIPNSQPFFLTKLIASEGESVVIDSEFQLFKYLTQTGKFYQYISDNSSVKEKKLIKEMIYKVLFGKNFRSRADDVFKSIFPTIHNFIKIYKKEHGSYKVLAHELQNLESNLVYNKIVKEIMYIYPEVKLVTVHDSIICEKKYRDVVEKIFLQNLEKEFNF